MYKFWWLRPLAHRCLSRRCRSASANRKVVSSRRRVWPCLEVLEDRITPTTFTPSTFADDGTANSLRGAITQANNDTGTAADTILLQAGSYRLSIPNVANNHDVSNAQGDLNITNTSHELDIVGTVDANGKPTTTITIDDLTVLDRIFEIGQPGGAAGITVTFKNLDIAEGIAVDDGGAGTVGGFTNAMGGGILDFGGNVTLSNVVLEDNGASPGVGFSAYGGGIYAENGSLTIKNSVIQSNNAFSITNFTGDPGGHSEGGGIWDSDGNVTLTNVTVQSNTATASQGSYASGGGIWATNGSLTVTSSVIRSNVVKGGTGTGTAVLQGGGEASGGGIYFFGGTDKENLNLTGSTVTSNQAEGGNGSSAGNGNGGNGDGAGIFISLAADTPDTAPSADISASTIFGNFAQGGNASGTGNGGEAKGGGVDFGVDGSGALQVVNSTFFTNSAIAGSGPSEEAEGGALFLADATATLTNDTMANNGVNLSFAPGSSGTAAGGGIFNAFATVTITNTLAAFNGNADFTTDSSDYSGAVSNSSHNLLGNADGSSGFGSPGSGDLLGTTANPLNPHLAGALANNGGPTQTLALLSGSPALNAGDNSAQSITGPFDQRGKGFNRVVNGTIDIGAFEVQPPPPPPPAPSPSPSPSPAPPPTLHTPPLLGFIDSMLAGIETINGNGTETVTDSFFGIPLFVSTYDGTGNLIGVTLFGIDLTFLFELL